MHKMFPHQRGRHIGIGIMCRELGHHRYRRRRLPCLFTVHVRTLTTTTTTTTTTPVTVAGGRTASAAAAKQQQPQPKRRSKRGPQLRPTAKDRIRSLADGPTASLMVHTNQAATFLQLRLQEAQKAVRGFWGREGTPSSLAQGGKPSIVMDRWWWTWNVALALAPAAMVAVSIELWGKPYVEKRLKEMEDYQRQKLGLLEDDEEEVEDEPILDIKEGNKPTPLFMPEQGKDMIINSSERATGLNMPTQSASASSTVPTLSNDAGISGNTIADALSQLAQRIQVLEQKLEQQAKRAEKHRQFQLQQSKQSGIQNRLHDKLILKEHARVDSMSEKESKPPELTTPPSVWDAASAYVQHNLAAKRDNLLEYGKQIVEGVSSSTDRGKNASDNGHERALPYSVHTTSTNTAQGTSTTTSQPTLASSNQITMTSIDRSNSDAMTPLLNTKDAQEQETREQKQSWWGSAFSRWSSDKREEAVLKKEP